MAATLQRLAPRSPGSGHRAAGLGRPRLLRHVPALTLALFLAPIGAGLVGTWLPAFGYLPALGGEALSLEPWRALFAYPGLPGDPYHERAGKYLAGGFGSVFTFGVRGGYEAGVALVEAVDLFSHLANVGDTRSLILHPASTTHRQLTDEQRTAAGAGPDVIRLSIGLETVDDLIGDLDQALARCMAE